MTRLIALVAAAMSLVLGAATARAMDPVAQVVERVRTPGAVLRVETTYATQTAGGKLVCQVRAAWGDLYNRVPSGSKYYVPWSGSIAVTGGQVALLKKIAWDGSGPPKIGTGRDRITSQLPTRVAWTAATVGAADALLFRVTFNNSSSSAILRCGGKSVIIRPIIKN